MKKYFLFLTFIVFISSSVLAQPGQDSIQYKESITGRVVDQSNQQPLAGAIVQVKEFPIEVITDKNGKFELKSIIRLPVTVIVTYVGYQQLEQTVNKRVVQFTLVAKPADLNEVVVVGYGTQKRSDITGSVSKINPAELKRIPVASFDAQLQGASPGLQVISNSGVPGEAAFVRVRGTTSINSSSDPLYIIDGVFLNNNSLQTTNLGGRTTSPLADINPADIESIEVLKDAAATAIYGSRGANGVIIVTTKKGQYNAKPKVSLSVSNGWVEADKSTLPQLASGPETATLANEYWINSGIDNPSLNRSFANRPFRPVAEGGAGLPEEQGTYRRLDDLLRKGRIQDYNLAIDGGNANSRYYLGVGYTDQEAFFKVIGFNRVGVKFNFDQKLADWVTIGLTNNLSSSYRNQARTSDGPQVSLWNSANSAATYTAPFAEDGTSVGSDNTYILIDNYDVNTKSIRYVGSAYVDATLAKGLKLRSSFSLDYNTYNESQYWNSNTSIGRAANGQAIRGITQNNTWINEQTLTYQTKWANHALTALAGNTLQSSDLAYTYAEGRGFANDNYKLISSASIQTSSESYTKYTLSSFFGRIGYNYASKYFAEATLRSDASSKFGQNNRWGYFPAFSVGWRIKEEAFFKGLSWLNELKLRASYGITGNQSGIDNFASFGLWSGGSSYADAYGTPLPGIGPRQLGNQNLSWEKTAQTDIGIDVAFLNNRFSVTADWYRKYTSGILLQQPIPSSSGFSSYWENVGEISNQGWELTLNSVNLNQRNFSWRTSLNISGNQNRIEKLPTPITRYTRDWVIMKEGYSMNSFWLYNQLYVDPKTGDAVFEGQEDGLTVDDRKIMNSFYPKFYGGLSNSFTYRDFDLSFLFSFQYGNYALNLNRYFRERNPLSGGVLTNLLNRWQQQGDITDLPRLTSVGNNYSLDQNSRYLEDASFLRLRQLTLGYNLPFKWAQIAKLKSARLYAVATNLFILTEYTGDPESNVTSDPTSQGIGSFGTPPQPRGFQFGLQITL